MKQVSDGHIKLLHIYMARQLSESLRIIQDSEMNDSDKEIALSCYKMGFKQAYDLINLFLEEFKK